MFSDDNRSPTVSMGNTGGQKPGWLFVLPWSLRESGGVNHVVKNLIRYFRDGSEYAPHLLVTSRLEESDCAAVSQMIGEISLDIWPPIDDRRPVRALLSFVYRFPGRYIALHRIVNRNN